MLVIAPARQRHHADKVSVTLNNCVISQSSTIKNLGVTFNSTLSFDQHIKEITKIAFYHLRNIAKIRSFLSTADAEILIHAFVSSRLDHCNAFFSGLSHESTKSLQNGGSECCSRSLNRYKKIRSYYTNLSISTLAPSTSKGIFNVSIASSVGRCQSLSASSTRFTLCCQQETICLFWSIPHFSNFCFCFLLSQAASCVILYTLYSFPPFSLLHLYLPFFIQAPFWCTTAPWDHLPFPGSCCLEIPTNLDRHTLGSAGSLLSSASLSPHVYIP